MAFKVRGIHPRSLSGLKDAVRCLPINASMRTLGVPADESGKNLRDFLNGGDVLAMVRLVVRLRTLEIRGLVVDIDAAI